MRVRVVNVVDLMTLLAAARTTRTAWTRSRFSELFTDHVDVVFAFHGYPGAIHQLVHGRPDADRFHVRGFIEEGTTTTPFDMVVRNRVVALPPGHGRDQQRPAHAAAGPASSRRGARSSSARHAAYVVEHLEDMPEVRDWVLPADDAGEGREGSPA